MMNFLMNLLPFILAQNEAEKAYSMVGMIVLAIIVMILVMDSTARFKSDYAPRSKAYKAFLAFFMFAIMIGAVILFRIYYK